MLTYLGILWTCANGSLDKYMMAVATEQCNAYMELCRVTERVILFSAGRSAARAPWPTVYISARCRELPWAVDIAGKEIARSVENSQEENTGWQNRVCGGNIDNFSLRRYAHFCASVRSTRVATSSAAFLDPSDPEIFARDSRFHLFTPCQSGFCCVQPRRRC